MPYKLFIFANIAHLVRARRAPLLSEKLVAKTIEFAGSLCHAEGFQT